MNIKRTIFQVNLLFIGLVCIIAASCKGRSAKHGMIIVTEAPINVNAQDFVTGNSWRYLPGARISAFHRGEPSSLKVLTKNFYSACSPKVSCDGKNVLFAAQQNKDEAWQIWEMQIDDLKCRKITSFKENCTDPDYLPGGRIVFSKLTINDTVKTAHCLFTCHLNGSGVRQVTFSPDACFGTTVLKDGRLLTINRQLVPDHGDPMLMVLRPDGTKADMFYKTVKGATLTSGPKETSDGRIVFTESDDEIKPEGIIISINYNRPLHTRLNMTTGINGDFRSVLPLQSNSYLVSYRKSDRESFALYEFDPIKKSLGKKVLSHAGYNILDAVTAEEYVRPKKLPSEVDMQVKTGLLLCQDINFLNMSPAGNNKDLYKASKIEVLGVDSSYGVVHVKKDGSFYLKVMADTPFRIRTLDEGGNIINGPCKWLWLRPNERRGCIGCHEDPELVPENKVSLAIKKSPAIIPVHISEVKEKVVELE